MADLLNNPAPDFQALDENGAPISLAQFRGRKVLLYFYPKDDTSVCTKQACNLNDNLAALNDAGIQVVGVSPDSPQSHAKFKAKYNLNFPLVADEGHTIAEEYGVWGEKSMYGHKYMGVIRTSFLINEQGIITRVIDKVKSADHAAQVLKGDAPKKKALAK